MAEICKKPKFETRRQEAMSLVKAGFSHNQTAKFMGISKKSVFFHLTAKSKPRFKTKTLTIGEKECIVQIVGKARGRGKKSSSKPKK